ncbi:MAG TPA: hypothetical protein VHV10_06190, partial [Ktedonobacteraceae bacterium]|nr:hypothetical protein [Ktedonobacteraceae bacterium]
PREIIKRGILISFNPATYTANVLILEATSAFLQGIPVACHLDGTSAQINSLCAVLFFDEQNYTDAVVLAVYPNASQGIPVPTPGRIVFVAGYQQFQNQAINAGVVSTFTLTGGISGIPVGALGVLYKAYFTSATVGAYIQLAPHAASDITAYASIGNLDVANGFLNGTGLLQLDASGRIDVKANSGTCTVTLYTHGYVF